MVIILDDFCIHVWCAFTPAAVLQERGQGEVRAERALQSIPIKSMYFTKKINRKFLIINTQQLFYARSARTSPIISYLEVTVNSRFDPYLMIFP